MNSGFIVSLVFSIVMLLIILPIAISMERKHIVREKGKIDYKKTKIYLRWNAFDTITISAAVYLIICV